MTNVVSQRLQLGATTLLSATVSLISTWIAVQHLQLRHVFNDGFAFGVGDSVVVGARLVIAVVLTVLLVFETQQSNRLYIATALGAGAANMLEHAVYGYIADWMYIGPLYFNGADVLIVCSLAALGYNWWSREAYV